MKNTVVDFESYYDKELSITTMGLHNYVRESEAYIVSIVGPDVKFCGTIPEVREKGLDKIALDTDRQLFAANSNFDQAWWDKYFPPAVKDWKCILDLAAFHQFPRDLVGVCRVVLHRELDKSIRDDMKGVHFEELPAFQQQRVIEYCLNDSLVEKEALDGMGPMSPVEDQLAAHTRLINRRGVHVNVEKIERDIELLGALHFATFNAIPWTKSGAKPLSYIAFSEYCYANGQKPPMSLDKRDMACTRWMEENPALATVLKQMRTYRGSNTKLEKLKDIVNNADDSGRIPLDLLYCGARHTRRWSSKNINVQNLDSKRVFAVEMAELPFFQENPEEEPGIYMREYFIPPQGCKLGILDYSQIEPRCLAWIVGNDEMLDAIRAGYGIYEAHAKATMNWKGSPGTMKKEFPDKYKFAKMRVLALGYGMGWRQFQIKTETDIGVVLTEAEARAQVADFRRTNPKITGLWTYYDQLIRNAAGDKEKILEFTMPTGDTLKQFTVRCKGRGMGFESYSTRGDFSQTSHQPRLWGGTLTENITQRFARDILAHAILNVEKAGLPVLFHAHDEIVIALPDSGAEAAFEEAKQIMSICPDWCPGLPLAVDGSIHDHYVKLA